MGYTFTWDDIEKVCRKLGMKRQGKTAIWKGIGPDGVKVLVLSMQSIRGMLGAGW